MRLWIQVGGGDVPDWAVTPASLDQLNVMLANIDEDLRQGALGIASTTGYMANGVTTLELFNVQRAAANYGRVYASHVRLLGNNNPPTEATLGAFEQIANGVALNQPLLLSHNNNAGWWEVEEHLQLLRDQGYNVWSEYYPYTCGSSTIGSEFIKPDNIGALGLDYTNLVDPRTGEPMNREIYDRIVAEDPAYIIVLCLPQREPWLPMWLEVPHMTVAGDQMPPVNIDGELLTWDDPYDAYNGHPRTAGTHAATLRLGREHNVPLMQTLAQNSYWSAKHLGDAGVEAMKVRGRMQEGMVADITIFDPDTVTDNATYKMGENGRPSTGIPYVLVNGTIMVRDSKVVDGVFPGQAIRFEPEPAGRFEPLVKEIEAEGGTALDAVETVVRLLEDDPVFDAGRGSRLNDACQVEMDAAVMEGAEDVAVIPVDIGWSDVGSWSALHDVGDVDNEGNTLIEIPLAIGVVGAMLLPVWAAIGAIAALVTNCTIAVERRED